MNPIQKLPYGSWPSRIQADALAENLRFDDLWFDSDGQTLLWMEGRGDRGILVRHKQGETVDLPHSVNIRGGVGYGGGAACLKHGTILFSERAGGLFRQSINGDNLQSIAPAFGGVASPTLSPDLRHAVYVFSDTKMDLLAMADASGVEWPYQLERGADFYMQPCWHPQNALLAWIEWDHPNMPWDGSRLMLGPLDGNPPRISEKKLVAGGDHLPVCQPQFSPDGTWLSYISAQENWDCLMLYNLKSGKPSTLLSGEGIQLTLPDWVQGLHTYGWAPDSKSLYAIQYQGMQGALIQIHLPDGRVTKIECKPYTWFSQLTVNPLKEALAVIASAPSIPPRIITVEDGQITVTTRSDPGLEAEGYFPTPKELSWLNEQGTEIHGIYYSPTNPEFTAEGLPPVILHIHGGPTSHAVANCSMLAAYFTSRGYAWFEVNYRGSTGYGREYRDALHEHWGVFDVEDIHSAAKEIVKRNLADSARMVLMGGSAGGFTLLNALIQFPGFFKAGVCLYGVSDLFRLAAETHKFEAHYLDKLIGPLPETKERYQARSPIFHADAIRDPLAIFQGSEDKVVPPAQSAELVEALERNGVPHIYRLYEGEGHGFRKVETISDFLVSTETFLKENILD